MSRVMLKKPHCSMTMSVDYRSKLEPVLQVMVSRLNISENLLNGTLNPKQTNRKSTTEPFLVQKYYAAI